MSIKLKLKLKINQELKMKMSMRPPSTLPVALTISGKPVALTVS
jgi:hypothetical protein